MNTENTFTIITVSFSVITLLSIWAIVVKYHIKNIQNTIISKWSEISEKIKLRHDLIPNLIETVRMHTIANDYSDLLSARSNAMREYFPTSLKFEYEHELTHYINEILEFCDKNDEIKVNTNFLELRKEISNILADLETLSSDYNNEVRKYNLEIKVKIIAPIAFLFRIKPIFIFHI